MVSEATPLRVSFYFFCDAHLWCQVSRTLLQYFQRYCLLRYFTILVANNMTHHWYNLHNRKTSISLKWKKIIQKEKRRSSVFWKAFQISRKYFSCHRHFKTMCLLIYIRSRKLQWFRPQFSCLSFKVPMTWKIFSAYLKGLSKYRRMAFFFLNYLFSF